MEENTNFEQFVDRADVYEMIEAFVNSVPYDLELLRIIGEHFKQDIERRLKIKLAYYELKEAESRYFITSWWWGRRLVKQQETLLKFYEITH
jgi:hypothetical protein